MKDCDRCRWFIDAYIPPSREQLAFMRICKAFGVMLTPDNRICTLGGCNGDRFERKDHETD